MFIKHLTVEKYHKIYLEGEFIQRDKAILHFHFYNSVNIQLFSTTNHNKKYPVIRPIYKHTTENENAIYITEDTLNLLHFCYNIYYNSFCLIQNT